MPFQRPTLPYVNVSLPNSNRYYVLSYSDRPRPPTAEMIDADLNYLIDTCNDLETQINGLVVGVLPGAEDPQNANLLPTTDGNSNISWIKIGSFQLEDACVVTRTIENDAITTIKIIDSAITSNKIANDSITTIKILNSNITTAKIADNAITTIKILDGNITTAKLAALSITQPKLALNSVGTAQIIDSNVTTAKIAAAAIIQTKLANDSVGTAQIIAANVTQAKLANNSVGTAQVIDANITAAKLAANSVTTAKILDANITTNKILDENITTNKILNNNITMNKLNGAFTSFTVGVSPGFIITQQVNKNITSIVGGGSLTNGFYTIDLTNLGNLPLQILGTNAYSGAGFVVTAVQIVSPTQVIIFTGPTNNATYPLVIAMSILYSS